MAAGGEQRYPRLVRRTYVACASLPMIARDLYAYKPLSYTE